MPDIPIHLKLPGLVEVAQQFSERGYSLADIELKNCNNEISDVGLVLGTDAEHCIVSNSVAFGGTNQSVYLDTPIGVMLIGKIDIMMKLLEVK